MIKRRIKATQIPKQSSIHLQFYLLRFKFWNAFEFVFLKIRIDRVFKFYCELKELFAILVATWKLNRNQIIDHFKHFHKQIAIDAFQFWLFLHFWLAMQLELFLVEAEVKGLVESLKKVLYRLLESFLLHHEFDEF